MLENIPKELQQLDQWVCADRNKLPKDPVTNFNASPTKASTWRTFEKAVSNKNHPHIGFVLTTNDPYTIIDLDDPFDPKKDWTEEERQSHATLNQSIIDSIDSYTEYSQSGTGVHIVVKGSIPKGVNRDTVEMYSCQRYMICTGNVMKDLPIIECQDFLDNMYAQMKTISQSIPLTDEEQVESDEEVYNRAVSAGSGVGERFEQLFNTPIDVHAKGESDSDFELMGSLAFNTPSNEQCFRMFRLSGRGKRAKVTKDDKYLGFTLSRIRGNHAAQNQAEEEALAMGKVLAQSLMANDKPVPSDDPNPQKPVGNIAALINRDRLKSPQNIQNLQPTTEDQMEGEKMFPPGLVGEIARYMYKSNVVPVPEIGLVAALGLLAGIVGQRYNVSNTGLNIYIVLLAETGMGKEGISSGTNRIINTLKKEIPGIVNFRGPGTFASAPGMNKYMAEKPCIFSIFGEFGLKLQDLSTAKAGSPQHGVNTALLEMFNKSGKNDSSGDTVYSDADKNTGIIDSPSLTIIGESTPSTFYAALSEQAIESGLLPRFSIVEYNGYRPYNNPYHGFLPDASLLASISDITTTVLTMMANNTFVDVQYAPDMDYELREGYTNRITDKQNQDKRDGHTNPLHVKLWSRAHMKLLKFAALLAVGENQDNPIITKEHYEWAKWFVEKDICAILSLFEKGDVGHGESKQEAEIITIVRNYFTKAAAKEYKVFHDQGVIPMKRFTRSVANLAAFKNDQRGTKRAKEEILSQLCSDGILTRIPDAQAKKTFNTTAALYALGDQWRNEDG